LLWRHVSIFMAFARTAGYDAQRHGLFRNASSSRSSRYLSEAVSMASHPSDRNLLFGTLALQMDFITRDALIAAMNAWVLDKARPLGQVLVDQGALSPHRRGMLEPLVDEHVREHGDDPARSLAAVGASAPVRDALSQIDDADLHASLGHVSADCYRQTLDATGPYPADTPSSAESRFTVLRPHAKGGLGEVYVAQDEELHREVALKAIQERHATNPANCARFVLEAELTGNLEHPGIVPVYGLGHYPDGRPYYAMRFIKGDSLKEVVHQFHEPERTSRDPGERALALRKLLSCFLGVCNAVAYAHSRGVLHRDLKPSNVMVGKYGETLVVDWGLAKVMGKADVETSEAALPATTGDGAGLTQAGTALGTPAYMSPEQAGGRLDLVGLLSDVYSLGATLYYVLTGQAPFVTADVASVLRDVQRGAFPAPRAVNRLVPPALQAVCLKAMALKPADRYASPRELAADIERWLADEPVAARPEPLRDRVWRMARLRPLMAAWLAIGTVWSILLIVGSVGVLAWKRPHVFIPFESLVWLLACFMNMAFFADLGALLGAGIGVLLGGVRTTLRAKNARERANQDAWTGAKRGLVAGAGLGYVASVVGLYSVTRTMASLLYPAGDDSNLLAVALGISLAGPVLGFTFGAIRKAKREVLLRRIWRGTLVGAVVGASIASGVFLSHQLGQLVRALDPKGRPVSKSDVTALQTRRAPLARGRITPPPVVQDGMQQLLLTQENLVKKGPTADAYHALGGLYNVAALAADQRKEPRQALDFCEKALRAHQTAFRMQPGDTKVREALRDSYRARAKVFNQLGRHADSLADWDHALEIDTWPEHRELRLQQALALARVGDDTKATEAAGALAERQNIPGRALYDLARVYALSVAAIQSGQHKGPPPRQSGRDKRVTDDTGRAIDLLRRAQKAGYFQDQANLAELQGDKDFDSLRQLEAFKELSAELAAQDKAGAK
jgi:hypothetical protein